MKYLVTFQIRKSISDIIDSSGITLILTPTLRTHDAGGMFVGVGIHDYQFIPPYEKEFTSTGQCSSECTNKVCYCT